MKSEIDKMVMTNMKDLNIFMRNESLVLMDSKTVIPTIASKSISEATLHCQCTI